jgi:hypothetical protein
MQQMDLIEILLPTRDNRGKPFPPEIYRSLRRDLTQIFGGVTAFTRAPASGEDKEGGKIVRDQIITLEVMTGEIDYGWWKQYRESLEAIFDQDEIVVRALLIEKL